MLEASGADGVMIGPRRLWPAVDARRRWHARRPAAFARLHPIGSDPGRAGTRALRADARRITAPPLGVRIARSISAGTSTAPLAGAARRAASGGADPRAADPDRVSCACLAGIGLRREAERRGGVNTMARSIRRRAGWRQPVRRRPRRAAASGHPRSAPDGTIAEANTAARDLLPDLGHVLRRRSTIDHFVPFGSPLLGLIEQVRERGAAVTEYRVDIGTPRLGGERVVDIYASPVGRAARARRVMLLQERSMAEKIDRQLTHRGAARTVTGLASMLAHEIKNPLSGIRGAAQLLEAVGRRRRPRADPPDLRRGRPHRQARRPHGGLRRRAADRARAGQHPCRARAGEAARATGFARDITHRRGIRSVAAAGPRQPRPAHPGLPQPREERRRGDRQRAGRRDRAHAPPSARASAFRCRAAPAKVSAAARILRQRQRPGRAGRTCCRISSIRSSRPRPNGTGLGLALVAKIIGDHGGRHRMRIAAAAARPSASCCRPIPAPTPIEEDELNHGARQHPRRRRRRRHPHGAEPGAVARRLHGAPHLQRRHAVALGQPRRGRPRHHRRGHAGRERLRPPAAHQARAARPADRRDERAEHLHDGDPRLGARRLRLSAEALRPEGADRHRRPRAGRAARRGGSKPRADERTTPSRWSAARRRCRTSTACSPG